MNTASTEHIIYLDGITETIVMRLFGKSKTKMMLFFIVCILAVSSFSMMTPPVTHASSHDHNNLAQDTLRPSIDAWGIEGPIRSGEQFTVWAIVSDADSGVLNVSAEILQDGSPYSNPLLEFNGTHFSSAIPGLELNHTYEISIVAFDNAENRAESYTREFDLVITTNTTINPEVTLPIVVGSSMIVLVALAIFSYRIKEKKKRATVDDMDSTKSMYS
ncbi:hypothetical protein EU537_05320 [Candidatus Thorarchaeota archaeon]|nr:MAG: hypothetical protein EU537_05320 [Candidatus Thorarchaeota archaeon]